MARLNEPPIMADSLETLRRKFLRQNRDIARVNSNQSLRIRALENECARLLSENLELRGQVLSLEKELDNNSSQRIADHALQVKKKMEAQMTELAALIAGLGIEPPTKRKSPAKGRQTSRPPRLSLRTDTSSPQPRRQQQELSPKEAELVALQEGRLPPIYENKTFPRRTLNSEEILALHHQSSSEGCNATESPQLGPPPVSRLLGDNVTTSTVSPSKTAASNKPESQAPVQAAAALVKSKRTASLSSEAQCEPRAAGAASTEAASITALQSTSSVGKPGPDTEKKLPQRGKNTSSKAEDMHPASVPITSVVSGAVNAAAANTASSLSSSTKAGAKRKFAVNDENAVNRGMKAVAKDEKLSATKHQPENSLPIRELKNPRSIRDLANTRKDAMGSTNAGSHLSRKPLGIKSTNEDVSTPRKKALTTENTENPKTINSSTGPLVKGSAVGGGRVRDRMKVPVKLDVPDAPLHPAVVEVHVEPTTAGNPATPLALKETAECGSNALLSLSADPLDSHSLYPNTPPPPAMSAKGPDTPPPGDISSYGETSRPNRRARASVSYAEPNLRDKMRRPTKELFDAVAGEGKYLQRQQIQHQHGQDSDGQLAEPGQSSMPTVTAVPASRSATDISQLVEKRRQEFPGDGQGLPVSSGGTDRRRRASSVGVPNSEFPSAASSSATTITTTATAPSSGRGLKARPGESLGQQESRDPYEFTMPSSTQPRSRDSSLLQNGDEDADEEVALEAKSGRSTGGRRSVARSGGSSSKATRRSSAAVLRHDVAEAAAAAAEASETARISSLSITTMNARSSTSRKRASMVSLKKASMLDEDEEDDDPADSSYEPPSSASANADCQKSGSDGVCGSEGRAITTRDRISRRKSMML